MSTCNGIYVFDDELTTPFPGRFQTCDEIQIFLNHTQFGQTNFRHLYLILSLAT